MPHIADWAIDCNGSGYALPEARTLAVCIDGSGPDYLEDALRRGLVPNVAAALAGGGRLLLGEAQVPTVTNANNASIVTGVSAAVHGISGNHYLAPDGRERQLTDPAALRAETVLAALARAGVPVLAVTAKEKLRRLLGAGGVPCVSAECAAEQTIDGLDGASAADALGGPVPDVYDPELSPYALDLSLALADRLRARLVYCSLTDYVQHKAAPGEPLADAYMAALDERVGLALDAGWHVGLVADHGMNAKARTDGSPDVRYLDPALAAAGARSARAILPIADPYVVHHGALGSAAFVYADAGELDAARAALAELPGVEGVHDRDAAARLFELPPDRIGDLLVLAGRRTVLGRSEREHDLSGVGAGLRSHGGLHERAVPVVLCQPPRAEPGACPRNADALRLLLGGGERAP